MIIKSELEFGFSLLMYLNLLVHLTPWHWLPPVLLGVCYARRWGLWPCDRHDWQRSRVFHEPTVYVAGALRAHALETSQLAPLQATMRLLGAKAWLPRGRIFVRARRQEVNIPLPRLSMLLSKGVPCASSFIVGIL